MPLRSKAKALFLSILVCLSLAPLPAHSKFNGIRSVTDGTAFTLARGDLTVGIISPLQYGILEPLTISTHPVLYLFLTPNIALRARAIDRSVTLSFETSYMQTFLESASVRFPGYVSAYPILSIPLANTAVLSFRTGYVFDIEPRHHGLAFGGGIAVLLGNSHVINLQGQDSYFADAHDIEMPLVTLTYTYAFYRLRVRVGIAVGHFPIQVGNGSADIKNIFVFPIVDLWWNL
jgi:hypothetical protein